MAGRRVYKNYDPRAAIIRKVAEEVFEIQGRDPLIEVAIALEKAARADEFFVKRNLYPNVDFYSGARLIRAPHLFVWCHCHACRASEVSKRKVCMAHDNG